MTMNPGRGLCFAELTPTGASARYQLLPPSRLTCRLAPVLMNTDTWLYGDTSTVRTVPVTARTGENCTLLPREWYNAEASQAHRSCGEVGLRARPCSAGSPVAAVAHDPPPSVVT